MFIPKNLQRKHVPASAWLPELWENTVLLFEASNFTVICYSSPRRRPHPRYRTPGPLIAEPGVVRAEHGEKVKCCWRKSPRLQGSALAASSTARLIQNSCIKHRPGNQKHSGAWRRPANWGVPGGLVVQVNYNNSLQCAFKFTCSASDRQS